MLEIGEMFYKYTITKIGDKKYESIQMMNEHLIKYFQLFSIPY